MMHSTLTISSSASASMSLPTSSGRKSLEPHRRHGPSVAASIAAPGVSEPPQGASAWTVNLASLTRVFEIKAREHGAEEHEDGVRAKGLFFTANIHNYHTVKKVP